MEENDGKTSEDETGKMLMDVYDEGNDQTCKIQQQTNAF